KAVLSAVAARSIGAARGSADAVDAAKAVDPADEVERAGAERDDVGLRPGGDSVTSCNRGRRAKRSCAPSSRGLSIHLAHARKSRLADNRMRNTARTGRF